MFRSNYRSYLAENEDTVASMGWEPLSVDQGFMAGDNR